MPNLVLLWSQQNHSLQLSKGGYNLLVAFAQFPVRVLEQCMFTHYEPTLNANSNGVTFFNVKLNVGDFNKSNLHTNTYQAVDITRSTIYAEESSLNKLSQVIGLSEVSVRNNMNWHKPTSFMVDSTPIEGYLQEVGSPVRTIPVATQLKPKHKLPAITLVDRTLHDLKPGMIHVIDVNTLKDVYTFDSEKELWLTLNPSKVEEYEVLSTKEQYRYLSSRVSIYVNLLRENGNPTELGTFHFCRHPDHLTKFKILATPFFAVSLVTGVCTWYANNNQVPNVSSSTVTRRRHTNTVTSNNLRFINADLFIKHYPDAVNAQGSTYMLTQDQLKNLPSNPSRNTTKLGKS